jgi:hypothetical protein
MTMSQFDKVSVVKQANVYFDGKCVSHTVLLADGSRKTLGVILPSTLTFTTGAPEVMEGVAGGVPRSPQRRGASGRPTPPASRSPCPPIRRSTSPAMTPITTSATSAEAGADAIGLARPARWWWFPPARRLRFHLNISTGLLCLHSIFLQKPTWLRCTMR